MKHHLPFLDGWKGLAIIWIMVGHIVPFYAWDTGSDVRSALYCATQLIFLSVDIFFIISGFLTAAPLVRGEKFEITRFLRNRAARLLPLYFAVIIIVLALPRFNMILTKSYTVYHTYRVTKVALPQARFEIEDTAGEKAVMDVEASGGRVKYKITGKKATERGELTFPPGEFPFRKILPGFSFNVSDSSSMDVKLPSRNPDEKVIPYFLLLENYVPHAKRVEMLGQMWFVSVLVHFWIIYAIVVHFVRRYSAGPNVRRNLSILFGLLIVAVNLLKWRFSGSYDGYYYHQFTHMRIDAIFFGCMLAMLLPVSNPKYVAGMSPLIFRLMSLTGLLAAAGICVYLWKTPLPNLEVVPPFLFTAGYMAFGLMILGSYRTWRPAIFFLENPLLRLIGRYSYGIFLVHYPLIYIYSLSKSRFHPGNIISIAVYLLLSILAGMSLELFGNAVRARLSKQNA